MRVALYGKSLVLEGIGALLECPETLDVIRLDSESQPACQLPADTDVLVFDLATALPAEILTFWNDHPRLALVGIDLSTQEAFVVSGQRTHARTAEDLVKVINSHARGERRYSTPEHRRR